MTTQSGYDSVLLIKPYLETLDHAHVVPHDRSVTRQNGQVFNSLKGGEDNLLFWITQA